ncbi:GNAT family N-acetyltransferase [Motilimonas sp. 1_MG-2023]|uniref:GNAT family N-acetyltransferase n=1 Tax=Motilimonas TaxID=1914248 RepID=UPI0026E1A164|nr:GNAT family N-acetyltransferase [Motilimonas sp. 1_MG-2023]MDO6525254.1 GNAT family N-acetyltransferase [Motilimonas sp. 1_MG-2023]
MEIIVLNWQQTLAIRQAVLWPNQPQSFSQVSGDEDAKHYGVVIDGKLVSVASIFVDQHEARLRKFATLQEFQGRGIGSYLIEHILHQLIEQGYKLFWCDARESALGFYQRFGMAISGERFYKADQAYFKMAKQL